MKPFLYFSSRNTINSLYPNQAKEKSKWLEDTGEYKDIMRKFENYGKATQPSLGSSLNWTYFCILVAIAVAVIVVNVYWKKFYFLLWLLYQFSSFSFCEAGSLLKELPSVCPSRTGDLRITYNDYD